MWEVRTGRVGGAGRPWCRGCTGGKAIRKLKQEGKGGGHSPGLCMSLLYLCFFLREVLSDKTCPFSRMGYLVEPNSSGFKGSCLSPHRVLEPRMYAGKRTERHIFLPASAVAVWTVVFCSFGAQRLGPGSVSTVVAEGCNLSSSVALLLRRCPQPRFHVVSCLDGLSGSSRTLWRAGPTLCPSTSCWSASAASRSCLLR